MSELETYWWLVNRKDYQIYTVLAYAKDVFLLVIVSYFYPTKIELSAFLFEVLT
jgi:hypothetical protein